MWPCCNCRSSKSHALQCFLLTSGGKSSKLQMSCRSASPATRAWLSNMQLVLHLQPVSCLHPLQHLALPTCAQTHSALAKNGLPAIMTMSLCYHSKPIPHLPMLNASCHSHHWLSNKVSDCIDASMASLIELTLMALQSMMQQCSR